MNHCLPREVLVEFLSDRLPPDQRESVGEHLAQCSCCQSVADKITDDEELRQFQRSHSQVPAEPSGLELLVELRNGLYDFCLKGTNAGTSGPSETASVHPATLGRYHLQRRLGAGGSGVVYLAEDVQLRRPVALNLPRLPALADPEGRGRFLREAKAAASLHHPHIVAVYDAGECDGVCYLASAYCPGQTLAEWFKDRTTPATAEDAAQILLALADAV